MGATRARQQQQQQQPPPLRAVYFVAACLSLAMLAGTDVLVVAHQQRRSHAATPSVAYNVSSWMASMKPLIENSTILDLSLPGSHDSMTYDLSTTVSDGSNDLPPALAWVLHEFRDLAPGPFMRNQSKTQGLSMSQQLTAGLRFIDFRIMYTSGPDAPATAVHDWYCLHFMESNSKAMVYLQEAKDFLLSHPHEILVMWFSRHGSECTTGNAQYPNVPVAAKQKFWGEVVDFFGDLLFDHSLGPLNETAIATMLQRGQRLVIYTSDYAEFTGNSTLAMDACLIDNQLGDDITQENSTYHAFVQRFKDASAIKRADKAKNRFYLQSMAASAPIEQIENAALIHFLGHNENIAKKCAAGFNIPGMVDWCPSTLQDISLLLNYYNQLIFEATIASGYELPNAIYIDAVDAAGTIRTGTLVFDGQADGLSASGRGSGTHEATRYAYVSTVAFHNARKACNAVQNAHALCKPLLEAISNSRAQFPLTRWNDPNHGRLQNWPVQ